MSVNPQPGDLPVGNVGALERRNRSQHAELKRLRRETTRAYAVIAQLRVELDVAHRALDVVRARADRDESASRPPAGDTPLTTARAKAQVARRHPTPQALEGVA